MTGATGGAGSNAGGMGGSGHDGGRVDGSADASRRDSSLEGGGGSIAGDSDAGRTDGAVEAGGPVCGDGKREGTEACDDGNKVDGDGCSSICTDTHACEACLMTNCSDNGFPLCTSAKGNAKDGPAAGVPREELCRDVYACVLRTHCGSSGNLAECYCGTMTGASCLAPRAANGPCKDDIEAGLETTEPTKIPQVFTSPDLGAGDAMTLLQCQNDFCQSECSASGGDAGAADAAPGGGG
jgi:cysteine-rich repeat protein